MLLLLLQMMQTSGRVAMAMGRTAEIRLRMPLADLIATATVRVGHKFTPLK